MPFSISLITVRESFDLEKTGGVEALDQGAALGAMVGIEDQRGNAVHVQIQRVTEQQHLK